MAHRQKKAKGGVKGKWDGQRVRSDAIGTKSSVKHVCVWCMIGRSHEGLLERR